MIDSGSNELMHSEGKSKRCTRRCIKRKLKRKIKHISTTYGDFHKPKFNLDLCTNPTACLRLGDALSVRLQSVLPHFSITRLSVKKNSSLVLDLLSLSF